MKSLGILLLLVGVWVIINSGNLQKVFSNQAKFNIVKPSSSSTTPSSAGRTAGGSF